MKREKLNNWYAWRKDRLDRSLFLAKLIPLQLSYRKTKAELSSSHKLLSAHLFSLSNKSPSSLSSDKVKVPSHWAPVHGYSQLWWAYGVYTKFSSHLTYSLLRIINTSAKWLKRQAYLPVHPPVNGLSQATQPLYIRLNRKL